MFSATLVLVVSCLKVVLGGGINVKCDGDCKDFKTIPFSLKDTYNNAQPLYVKFMENTDYNALIDGICYTYAALPDNGEIYQLFTYTNYKDGSSAIKSYMATDLSNGGCRAGSYDCDFNDYVLSDVGCNTYLVARCYIYGDCLDQHFGCHENPYETYGISSCRKCVTKMCLSDAKDAAKKQHVAAPKGYITLPYKYDIKCVTSPVCTNDKLANFLAYTGYNTGANAQCSC